MEPVDRENEVLRIIDVLSKSGAEFIVVGGYAVSSLARHRFSVDSDVVVRNKDLKRLDSILTKESFSEEERQTGFDSLYGGKFIRYVKKMAELPVSVDLLVDSLVCRQTDASWSFDYISSNSHETIIPGIQFSTRGKVPNRELLIAFKMHSARKADVRDIVVLGEAADWTQVSKHVNRGDKQKLLDSVGKVLNDLDDEKLFNSLKGAFSIKEDVGDSIAKAKKEIAKIHSVLVASSGKMRS